jgi:hypothetical protein
MGERYRGRGQWDGPRGQPGSRDREVSFVDSVGSGGEESHNPLRIPNLPSVRTSQPSHSLRTHCAGRCATAKRFLSRALHLAGVAGQCGVVCGYPTQAWVV